jgi:hypothetical protein
MKKQLRRAGLLECEQVGRGMGLDFYETMKKALAVVEKPTDFRWAIPGSLIPEPAGLGQRLEFTFLFQRVRDRRRFYGGSNAPRQIGAGGNLVRLTLSDKVTPIFCYTREHARSDTGD